MIKLSLKPGDNGILNSFHLSCGLESFLRGNYSLFSRILQFPQLVLLFSKPFLLTANHGLSRIFMYVIVYKKMEVGQIQNDSDKLRVAEKQKAFLKALGHLP